MATGKLKRTGYHLTRRADTWHVFWWYRALGESRAIKRSRTTATKGETPPSDRKCKEIIRQAERGFDGGRVRVTIVPGSLLALVDDYERLLRAGSASYAQNTGSMLRFSLGAGKNGAGRHALKWKKPPDINYAQLEDRLVARVAGKEIGNVSAQNEIRVWKGFASWLAERKYLSDNPLTASSPREARRRNRRFPKATGRKPLTLETPAQIAALLEACRYQGGHVDTTVKKGARKGRPIKAWQIPAPRWLYPVVFFAVHQGPRAGGVHALHWRHVDLVGGEVELTEKGLKTRYVPLHPAVRGMLEETPAAERTGPVFPDFPYEVSPRDGTIRRGYYKAWTTALERAKLPHMKFHALRDTFASHSLMAGVSIALVSEWLGHASLQTTLDHYGFWTKQFERAAITKLDYGL